MVPWFRSKLFDISDCPFLTSVAEAPDEIVSCKAYRCAGENGDGGLNDCCEAFTEFFFDAELMCVWLGSYMLLDLCQLAPPGYPGLAAIYGDG